MISYKRSLVYPLVSSNLAALIGIGVMTKPEPAVGLGLVFLLVAILSAVYAYVLRQQGEVFLLTAEGLDFQEKIGSPRQHFSMEEIGEMRYIVRPIYRDFLSHKLRIVGNTGNLLVEVNLNALAGADFNDIYHFVQEVAPYVQWDFPTN